MGMRVTTLHEAYNAKEVRQYQNAQRESAEGAMDTHGGLLDYFTKTKASHMSVRQPNKRIPWMHVQSLSKYVLYVLNYGRRHHSLKDKGKETNSTRTI